MENRKLLTCLTDLNCLLRGASTAKYPEKEFPNTDHILNKITEVSTFSQIDFDELLSIDWFVHLQILVRLGNALYQFSRVPTFKGREDIGYDRIDFSETTTRAEYVIPCLTCLIRNTHPEVINDGSSISTSNCVLELLQFGVMLYGEHAEVGVWTSDATLAAGSELLKVLLTATSCATPSQMLCNPHPHSVLTKGMASWVLAELKPKLQKGIWKNSPSSADIFKWTLFQMRFPYVTPFLPIIFPPCLLLTDDHEAAHKAAGIRCLHHIILESTNEELRYGGRADVMVAAVEHALYTQDEEVLKAVLVALPDVLSTAQQPPCKAPPPRIETRYDVILERILQSMELEQKISYRRLYARHLPTLLSAMGLTLCRHLSAILGVVYSYLQIQDGNEEEARLAALTILHTTIKETWPRMPHHVPGILTSLVRLIHDLSTDNIASAAKTKLFNEAVNCARLLRAASPDQVEQLLGAICIDNNKEDLSHAFSQCRVFAEQALHNPTNDQKTLP